MTRYIRKLKITSTSGTVHEVWAVTTSHSPKETRELRKAAWDWVTSGAYRARTTKRGDLRNAVHVEHQTAIGVTSILKQTVARRAGIIIQKAESPAWMPDQQEVS